ncbi:MAG: sterol desaturase family protein [Bacteroidetes bacterium]|nr:sterol desaturase family protein [Bacteroidota bacterium]
MEIFREELLLKITTPVYVLVIGTELIWSYVHHKKYYSTKGILSNIYLSALNFGLDILVRVMCLAVLGFFFQYRFATIDKSLHPFVYWFALLIGQDFMFYWLHRVDHYCRFFWAVHVTHHSSEEFNLTVGFRSSVFQPLYRFIYFIPLALVGFEPLDILFMYAATQIYGILIHTKTIGKLGPLEWFLSTPSHHRVHHASNIKYLDKNMGMVLIIWDKLFGTFQAEEEEVRYGLTKNIETYNPFIMVFHEWISIGKDLKKGNSIRDKFMYVFGPPGWSHDGSTKTSSQLRAELRAAQNQPK